MSCLVVQLIEIAYDDDHRGAAHATRRARFRAFPLPATTRPSLLHTCDVTTWRDYAIDEATQDVPLRDGRAVLAEALEVEPVSEPPGLRVVLRHRDAKLLKLAVPQDTWVRIVWNHKAWAGDHKWLVERVANIGLFRASPPAGIFLGEPASLHDARHDFNRNAYAPR